MFGLSAEWLLDDGRPIADALILSHPEQLDRLTAQVPQAAHTAVIAGDPCYDRMLASRHHRPLYRAVLDADDARTLVVVSSTWSSASLLGSWPDLIRTLMAELPVDTFRVAAIVHPNAVAGHGAFQLRSWLADSVRAGLYLVPQLEGWQATLLAADCVIGDHGSVTCYGAALGHPTLLASFPDDEVVPGTAVHQLGRLATHLHRGRPLRAQLEDALATHHLDRYVDVAALVTAVPGESPQRLRTVCYRLLDLSEPDREAPLHPLPPPALSRPPTPRSSALLVAADVDLQRRTVGLSRFVAQTWPYVEGAPVIARTHLVVHHAHPGRRLLAAADIVFAHTTEVPGDVDAWLGRALLAHPGAAFVAVTGDGTCRLAGRDGEPLTLHGDRADPATYVSAYLAWLSHEPALPDEGITVRAGAYQVRVAARPTA